MEHEPFELRGPALLAFGVLLAAVAAVLVGDAIGRVIDCRRRGRQRERELAALEAYHNLVFPRAKPLARAVRVRPPGGTNPGSGDRRDGPGSQV